MTPPEDYLDAIDLSHPDFGDLYDELPLWSAPFGLFLLERVPMRPGLTILDVGAGTGFLTMELAQPMRFADGSSLLRHWFMRPGFVPAWKAVAPPDAVERTFAALARRLDALAAQRGELALTVPMVCVEARRP